jgi:hypothetical protein
MSEVVKSPAMIIIILVVLVILLFFIFEFFYEVKIGRGTCKFVGGVLLKGILGTSILTGITEPGIIAVCNLLPF